MDGEVSEFRMPGMAVVSRPDGTHLIVAGDADVARFPIRRATKSTALRFAVGEPGNRGTIWRLWANRGTNDVYIASRQTASEVKISLHQSGDWRMQIVEPDRPKTVHFGIRGRQGRILHRWQRPQPNAVGWTLAFTIVLPGNQLSLVPNDQVRWDDVRWCPAPRASEQAEFDIYLVTPNQGMVSHRSMLLEGVHVSVMDALELSGGDVAIVLALIGPSRPDELTMISRFEEKARKNPPPAEWDCSSQLGPRRLLTTAVQMVGSGSTIWPFASNGAAGGRCSMAVRS